RFLRPLPALLRARGVALDRGGGRRPRPGPGPGSRVGGAEQPDGHHAAVLLHLGRGRGRRHRADRRGRHDLRPDPGPGRQPASRHRSHAPRMTVIPIAYNVQSVGARWRSTIVAVIGIAGTVGVFVAMLAMAHGFQATLVSSGSPRNAMVRRAGSTSEMD